MTTATRTTNQPAYRAFALGSIKPEGWLKEQLQIQADGLSGHLSEVWEDVGSNNGWLGGTGDAWERGPYYLDGLLPLAYLLEDDKLIEKVRPWVEWTLSSQIETGQFGPEANPDWWARMIMLKVLTQYAEVTGDNRVVSFLTKYFRYQLDTLPSKPLSDWGQARGGENIMVVQWLYERTGDAFLLDLIELIHEQTTDWTGIFNNFPYWRYQEAFDHRIHVVNVAMGLKEPALYYLQSGQSEHRDAATQGIQSLMTHHGQVNGMFSGDEWLAGTHPSQGTELCAVVEYMFTLETLFRVLGDSQFGDILEKVAFNALPATISPEWLSHQYDQQVNQVVCSLAKRKWTLNDDDSNLFGLEPNFGCCTANMHQGWPKLVAHLWMQTKRGLCAVSYAPCRVSANVGETDVALSVDTTYPFSQHIQIGVSVSRAADFELKLRVPGWADEYAILVNGSAVEDKAQSGFVEVQRTWQDGDTVEIEFGMKPRLQSRANGAVGVECGPLVYALPIQERWQKLKGTDPYCDWEVYPESAWNYALVVQPDDVSNIEYHAKPLTSYPFVPKQAPTSLIVSGRRVPQWGMAMNSANTPPMSPVKTTEPVEPLKLVPYGSARLRIAEFPVTTR